MNCYFYSLMLLSFIIFCCQFDHYKCYVVDEKDSCHDGLYFNKTRNQCDYCLRCKQGQQPVEPCEKYKTGTNCEYCPVGTFAPDNDNWLPCQPHTSCPEKHRSIHVSGSSENDNICGTCLPGYTEILSQDGKTKYCWICSTVVNPPPECDGYIDKDDDNKKGGGEGDDSTEPSETPNNGSSEDDSSSNGGGTGKDGDYEEGDRNDNRMQLMLLMLAVCVAFIVLIAIFVVIALVIIRITKRGGGCGSLCPVGLVVKHRDVRSGGRGEQTDDKLLVPGGEKERRASSGGNRTESVILPEIIVAQNPGRNMYSRQLSDTIVQLKLFQLQPTDIVSSATDTSSNEDLLQLLSARSAEEQTKWRVQMVHRIFSDAPTWSLQPDTKEKLIKYYLYLDQASQVQLGRAFVDIFKIDTSQHRKIKMDQLVKLVINKPETTIYELVSYTFQNCMDLRVTEVICDELFSARKKMVAAEKQSQLDTIQESAA